MYQLLPSKIFEEKDFIKFLVNEGIEVKTSTKARGNLGICMKNRIDVSKNAPVHRRMQILAHEYAHKIHHEIEKEAFKKGGTLEKLFETKDTEFIKKELIRVTHFVDENSLFLGYSDAKTEIQKELKILSEKIRLEYPDFKRSEEFVPIKKYFRKTNSNAKFLLRYDNVKIISPVFKKETFISIKTVDTDFRELPEVFRDYLKLVSLQRKQKKISSRKNRLENYYNRPTELFARFVEGLFIGKEKVRQIAPLSYNRFELLLHKGHYGNLKQLLLRASIV